jgi:hypothetical protein
LGNIPLRILAVDRECEWIYNNPVPVDLEEEYSFEELIKLFSSSYEADERIWSKLDMKCRDCSFKTDNTTNHLKSGFHECWKHLANFSDEDFTKNLVLELWGGKAGAKSLVGEAVRSGKYFLSDLKETDYAPKTSKTPDRGMSPVERRTLQINTVRTNSKFTLDRKGIEKVFNELPAPWHFIDFETSAVALPFHKGRSPYEAIAFQYSYHVMEEDGSIAHKSQFLSSSPAFPNYDFLRALKADLKETNGTIFRYHNHENTYMNHIYRQLQKENKDAAPDKDELIDFLCCISHNNGAWCGERDMQDLYELVLSYYLSPYAKGSNSLKYILPAAINDSKYLVDKYSQPIYGSEIIPSLNFNDHVLILPEVGLNPYKTLPPVLDEYDNNSLDETFSGLDEIKEGGAAMIAYSYLQFAEVPPTQKEAIKKALFKYCEIDTMAMVMLWEFWGNEIGRFK